MIRTSIDIDAQPISSEEWYPGIYTVEDETEDEDDKEYSFTAIVSNNHENGYTSVQIVWEEGIPDNKEQIEKEIKEQIV